MVQALKDEGDGTVFIHFIKRDCNKNWKTEILHSQTTITSTVGVINFSSVF